MVVIASEERRIEKVIIVIVIASEGEEKWKDYHTNRKWGEVEMKRLS